MSSQQNERTQEMVLYAIFLLTVVFVLNPILLLVALENVSAEEGKEQSAPSSFILIDEVTFNKFIKDIKEGFDYLLKAQTYGTAQKIFNDSILNPNNDFLKIPRYTADLELRPDFSLNYWRLKLSIKPRLHAYWQGWDQTEGSYQGDRGHVQGYVNEYLASLKLAENLFVSYGQENLQWGPSFLLSPSNPFFRVTGRANPKMEIPGMDFARLVWLYNPSFTISLIANVDKGRQSFTPPFTFVKTYALKFDYTTKRKYFSAIVSYQDNNDQWPVPNDRISLGGYGGWTVSDALLVYGEGAVTIGSNVLYPQKQELGPGQGYAITLSPTKADSSNPTGTLLLGGSYTFKFGSTVALEYVFNSPGYTKDQAKLYFQLHEQVTPFFTGYGPKVENIAGQILAFSLNTGLRLLRQNYLMFQIAHPQLWDVVTITSRAVYNIDDRSYMLSPVIEYNFWKHFGVFLIGSQNFGPKESEFRSIVGYSWMVGLEYTL